jgi:glycosyltransferase involved in cell wall biosynthesis
MQLTIITPTLNAVATLQRCIGSVKGQNIEVEHLFIDGGSTDGTREILGTFIDAPGSSIYEAQNIGIEAAKGKWLYFLGADDRVFLDELEVAISQAANYPVLHGNIVFPGRPTYLSNRRQQAWLYRKDLFAIHGMYNVFNRVYADIEFQKKLKAASVPVLRVSNVFADVADGGISSKRFK